MIPYLSDLLPFRNKFFEKRHLLLNNIEQLTDAMPIMMAEKKYLLPHFNEILDKLHLMIPVLDDILPNMHKLAPKIGLLLPHLELLIPHLKVMMPLWDELEPQMEVLMSEIEHLGPLLDELAPKMGKMTPVMDLLPIAHELKLFEYSRVVDSLPFMMRFLPKENQNFQRLVLKNVVSGVAMAHEKAKEIYEKREKKLIDKAFENCFNRENKLISFIICKKRIPNQGKSKQNSVTI
eukprot:snap_masked-scaffold_6-processed-gene-1.17-mRNA-1 protein AED:1.00 eAED:1.00 QI:0/0/0/0/1/1/4/0/234